MWRLFDDLDGKVWLVESDVDNSLEAGFLVTRLGKLVAAQNQCIPIPFKGPRQRDKKRYFERGSNSRPSACEADVITTTPSKLVI